MKISGEDIEVFVSSSTETIRMLSVTENGLSGQSLL